MNAILDNTNGLDLSQQNLWKGRGRPKKDTMMTQESLDYAKSRETLKRQCGVGLPGRAADINDKFDSNINADDLRSVYKNNRITKQKLRPQIVPKKFKDELVQIEEIMNLQREI